jgi:CheY-like chemotaxis protein
MTDAFWTAMWTSIPATIAATVAAVAALRGNASSRANSKVLDDVHDKVNGGLHAAVAAAEESARRRIAPRVLIVDDEPDAIEIASIPLRKFGCEIFTAHTASEAERLLMSNLGPGRGFPFDFVLVDLRMPGGGSETVFDTFTRIAPRIPLVILSGQRMGSFPPTPSGDVPRIWIQKPLEESHVQSLLEQFSIPYHRVDAPVRPVRRERKTDRNGRKSDDKTIA